MARDIAVIKQQMLDTKAQIAALDALTSNSQVSIFGNLFFVNAVNISILEQLIDLFISQIETIINEQGIGSTPWLRSKVLEFQYGDSVVLNTTTFIIAYPTITPANQIITRCSVVHKGNLIIDVKVAKSDPPVPLVSLEKSALADYIAVINPPGTQINIVSLDSDKLYIAGVVYYSGQFSSVIQANVESALTNYMANLSSATNFDGTIIVTDIIETVRAVEGVKDFAVTEIAARADLTTFADRTIFYNLASSINNRRYTTFSGYVTEETDSGHIFSDTITYSAV